ncbi:MAG TPA: serine/threonine-protein kinase [Polyangiaceae bacterium]|nr:serine/threonine-protein kinase [Polyangiaceae bacterium]
MPDPASPAPPASRARTAMPSSASLMTRRCPVCDGRFPTDFRVCPRDAVALEDAPEGEDPLVGSVLADSYEVTRVLGEGGMGRVYEARHTRLTGKRFAIKLLHPDLARQPEVVTRFQREAEAASGISHPNVLGVNDVNVTLDGQPYIVSELLQGEELGEYLYRVGKLSISDAIRIVRQICKALGAAHEAGVVHRDVKPENVFLTGDLKSLDSATVKVIDFGISKVAQAGGESLTKTGMVMGTPDYMPPEQARGDKVDARADIYAVGAILYRALTGKKPFEGLDPMATLTAVLVQEPGRPTIVNPEVPLALELVIQRAMAKDPKDRYATMAELERELAAFDPELLSRPSAAPPPHESSPPDANAATVVKRPSPRALRAQLQQTQQSVKVARPGLLVFTGLGFVWLFANVAVAVGGIIRSMRGEGSDLSQAEAVLSMVGVAAALVTPLGLWVRHLMKEVWPSTPKSLELMARLRGTVLYSAAAYGIAALAIELGFAVIERRSALIARPIWALLTFLVALATAGVSWWMLSARRR